MAARILCWPESTLPDLDDLSAFAAVTRDTEA